MDALGQILEIEAVAAQVVAARLDQQLFAPFALMLHPGNRRVLFQRGFDPVGHGLQQIRVLPAMHDDIGGQVAPFVAVEARLFRGFGETDDALELVAHVFHQTLELDPGVFLDRDRGQAAARFAAHAVDAGHAADRIFDAPGNALVDLARGTARVFHRDDHLRGRDLRKAFHPQRVQAQQARRKDEDHHQIGGDRVVQKPARDCLHDCGSVPAAVSN